MAKRSNKLFEEFGKLKDPRIERRKLHKLEDIIIITLFAVIAGCNEWAEIEIYAKSKLEFLKQFCDLENGIPSHDTFERLFERLNPKEFQECFVSWIKSLNLTQGLIAIDGKTVRGSGIGKSAIHMVSAWNQANQLCLGQEKTEGKSNEITAIPKLLKALDLKDSIVTIDAMGTQKNIVAQIVDQKGDYILALKKNHRKLYEEVEELFCKLENKRQKSNSSLVEKSHGRIEKRECYVLPFQHKEWKGLKSVVMVKSRRKVIGGEEQRDTRYYLSSLEADEETFSNYIRGHWSIENTLHWSLDVTFKEDASRKRRGHTAENFAIIRRLVLTLLKAEPSKIALKNKRLKAALDDNFLLNLLANF